MTASERFASGDAALRTGGRADPPAVPVVIRGRADLPGGESERAAATMAPAREDFPLLARPEPGCATRDLKPWAAAARRLLDDRLAEVGAVLLRGLPLRTPAEFSDLYRALGYEPLPYRGFATRDAVAPEVFTANVRDPSRAIMLHNDMSHEPEMCAHLFLFCETPPPPGAGGETPIARATDWKEALGDGWLERFARRGLLRRTNSPTRGDARKSATPWQVRYRTEDPEVAEAACREQGDVAEWEADGSLSTARLMDAVCEHRGETVWCCTPQSTGLTSAYAIDYGDGEPIEPHVLETLRALQWNISVAFAWEPGDVLCLDNVGCQHGRLPLAPGAERRILTAQCTARPGTARMPASAAGG